MTDTDVKHAGQHLGVSLEHGRLKLHRPVTRYWPPRIAHRLRILIHQLAITTSELMWTHDRKSFPNAERTLREPAREVGIAAKT